MDNNRFIPARFSCGHCVASTRKALEAVEGTTAVEVSLDKAIVKGDASSQSLMRLWERGL